jgi:mono/diheme cytochrome c family protein
MPFRPTKIPILLLAIGLLPALAPPPLDARDDVPPEIASRPNPVTALEPREERDYRRQYKAKCARCHGLDGKGGGEEAAQQPVAPADFSDARLMGSRSDGQLYYQILMGGGERCAMPAFGPGSAHAWDDDKIWHMVAFIRLFAPIARSAPDAPEPE